MNRNVKKTMNDIFEVLKNHVADEDLERIQSVRRHIKVEDEKNTFDFVKGCKILYYNKTLLGAIYNEDKYVLFPISSLNVNNAATIGEILYYDNGNNFIVDGMGMLAIVNKVLSIKKTVKSLEIINKCLGINEQDISFPFEEIKDFFEDYRVIKIYPSAFKIEFKEDFDRLNVLALLSQYEDTKLVKNNLNNIILLNSSRSIAGSLFNSIINTKWEYKFLQLYHCLEYLFVITSAENLISKYSIEDKAAIDISLDNIAHKNEKERLMDVVKNADVTVIDDYYNYLKTEKEDKIEAISADIYKIRCCIAHFRFDQEKYIEKINQNLILEKMIALVLSIYNNLNTIIEKYCNEKKTWLRL